MHRDFDAQDDRVGTLEDASVPCASLEAILAGTLSLMSHYARTPTLPAGDKIARNLALVARHPSASAELQTVCSRLFIQWLGPLDVQDSATGSDWRDVWPMPPRTQ